MSIASASFKVISSVNQKLSPVSKQYRPVCKIHTFKMVKNLKIWFWFSLSKSIYRQSFKSFELLRSSKSCWRHHSCLSQHWIEFISLTWPGEDNSISQPGLRSQDITNKHWTNNGRLVSLVTWTTDVTLCH